MAKAGMWLAWALVGALAWTGCGGANEAADEQRQECAPEARRCLDGMVQVCAGTQGAAQWIDAEACAVGCEAGACKEAEEPLCDEGQARCVETVVQRCDAAGHWQQEDICAFGCSEGSCTGACLDETLRCDGLQGQRCVSGAWQDEGEACAYTCAHGVCAGACATGETRCWEDIRQRCDEGVWANEESCPFVCTEGACAGECVPGARDCAGPQPRQCEAGVWQNAGPACEFECRDGGCTGVCDAGAKRCQGDALQACDDDGAWQVEAICPFVCSGSACAGYCVPGTTNCAEDGVELCTPGGHWRSAQTCAAGCSAGVCDAVCSANQTRCLGDAAQRCDAQGQWQGDVICEYGCNAGACLACETGETRCAGAALETCMAPGSWDGGLPCPTGTCVAGACIEILTPSCSPGGPGLSDCGDDGRESCCASALVPGGLFLQDNEAALQAEISSFQLDKYEITVGRFRQFVAAMEQRGWLPHAGEGKHEHLAGGRGLLERGSAADWESGWEDAWTAMLPGDWNAAFAAAYGCNWTASAGSNEKKAMNCIHWQEAYAFCIWDGGFLPSEAEWNYAAAGGGDASGQRLYPWGAESPEHGDYAIHMDSCPGGGWCMAPDLVGTKPLGAARWGHLDMAGNAAEWVLDWYETPYPAGSPCVDCANLSSTRTMRGMRGGAHWDPPGPLLATDNRYYGTPDFRVMGAGARCARAR